MNRLEANVATVQKGRSSRQLVNAAGSEWIAPGAGEGASLAVTGARLQFENQCADPGRPALTRGWDLGSMGFTLHNAHGDSEAYGYWLNAFFNDANDTGACGRLDGFRLTHWDFPQGVGIGLVYGDKYRYRGPGPATMERLVEVNNTLGWTVDFAWGGGGDPTHLASFGDATRTVALDWSGSVGTLPTGHIDAEGKHTNFAYRLQQSRSATQRPLPYNLLDRVLTADNLAEANVAYTYDGVNRVQQIQDAVAIQQGGRDPYTFYLADGTRGERDDPLGQPYSVVYDTFGHASRYSDELGLTTKVVADGRGRTLSTTYPAGDCEVFAYDESNNTTDLWRVDTASACNTAAGPTHVLHASATWNATWNKPATVTNPRGKTTTLTYRGTSEAGTSLLATATRPAIPEGTPVYQFSYTALGQLDTATGPTGIVTKNSYDSGGKGELVSTVADYGGLNLTTAFGYDAFGNVTSTTDPRGKVTTSTYDLNRRKTEDDRHDGGASANIIAASKTIYDAVGRVTDEQAATAFSGTSVTTWQTMKHTVYTPTSKVASVTDADSRTTTTSYDDADRTLTVTDPIGRKLRYAYCAPGNADCAANAVKTEYRAWQSGAACSQAAPSLQQCYRRVTYHPDGEVKTLKDANGNTTSYSYDGWRRLTQTSFPDNTILHPDTEDLDLDDNGNVTARKTRAGQTLTYSYNDLDWMTQKVSPSPAVTTDTTYLLDGRVDTLSDTASNTIDYGYDSAGRLTSVQTTIPGNGSARVVNYTLDANGNRTKLKWPNVDGGDFVGYCYDSLNRMTAAMDNSTAANCTTNLLATYSYDPLSRRTNLTYGNGAQMSTPSATAYSAAGDLLNLAHVFPGGTSNNNTFTWTYTPAHQTASFDASKPSWLWKPSANSSTAYGTANNLNQYPTVDSIAQSYDGNGNLTSDGTTNFTYDAENRLLTASKTGLAATYLYDPLGRRTKKSGTGVTTTTYLSDGTDEIAEYDSAHTLTRRIVPGPAIDEPIAIIDAAGTKSFFHTDKQGSVVAMSDSTGALVEGPNVYDAYGNCFFGGTSCAPSLTQTPYLFTGRRFDPETGLYYYRARFYDPKTGRFPQPDPVGYEADLNLYPYPRNDPTDKTDPLGLYDCSGNKSDCGAVNQFVTTINKSLAGLNPKSDAYAKVSAVVSYLGKAGDNNGVTINPTSLPKSTLANAGPNGVINVDVHQISSASVKYGAANPGMSSSGLRNATGAGALAHEGRHERDFMRIGFPNSKASETRTEMNAYWTQAGVWQGLGLKTGLWYPGMTPQQENQAVSTAAQASTTAWCNAGGACGP